MNRRPAIFAAAVLGAIALALAVALWPEDEVAAPELSAPPEHPRGAPAPTPFAADDAPAPVDAGALLAAWAAALQPVLKADGGPSTAAVFMRSSASAPTANPFAVLLQKPPPPPLPDGGRPPRPQTAAGEPEDDAGVDDGVDAGPACDPGPVRLALRQSAIDVVVAIDTSGSMYQTMALVNQWLIAFEAALRAANRDYQLFVVVDLDNLQRMVRITERRKPGKPKVWKPSDAGVNVSAPIDSDDALAVLLETAGHGRDSWLAHLRPELVPHIVVVTDDEADPTLMRDFLSRLTVIGRGQLGTVDAPRFTLDALLGMETSAEAWVVAPTRPLVPTRAPCGVDPGATYQLLAQKTGGLRGSVCHEESLKAFTQALVGELPALRCDAPLPPNFPADRPLALRAMGRDGRVLSLGRAFDAFNCEQATAAYLVANHRVRVCPRSCAALTDDGYDWIEATGTCPR